MIPPGTQTNWTEADKAKAWRHGMGMSMDQLARKIGYSREAIFLFERGINSLGKPHKPSAWRRYKLACLAVRVLNQYKVETIDQWEWQ